MKIGDRTVSLIIFLASVGAAIFYWLTVGDIVGSAVYFLFGTAIATMLLFNGISINHAMIAEFLRKIGLLPKPTEASLLVLALSTLALIAVNNLWGEVFSLVKEMEDIRAPFLLVYVFFGIVLAVYHAFTTRKKSEYEEAALRTYLSLTLVFLSINTVFLTMNEKQPGYLFFAIWSGIQALALIAGARTLPKEYVSLPTRDAKLIESAIAVLTVLLGVWLGHYVFQAHWSVTFSSIVMAWSLVQVFFEQRYSR